MEQQQLPLIEATDPAAGPAQASPVSTTSSPSTTVGGSGVPPKRRGRRTGSTGPRAGSPGTDWRLDEHTRAVGREGVAAARALLNRADRAA
jgi:hypothetical protein